MANAMGNDPKTIKAGDIWSKLAAIDVSPHVEKRNGLSYLSWAWAWAELMKHYPSAEYEFERFGDAVASTANKRDCMYYPGGSAAVFCRLTIDGITREMSLPVMDHRHRAIKANADGSGGPDARAVSDARARCLVKAMALFGLGHNLYAGSDLPTAPAVETAKPRKAPPAPAAPRPRSAAMPTPAEAQNTASLLKRLASIQSLDQLYGDNDLRLALKSLPAGSDKASAINEWKAVEERFQGSKATRPDFTARDANGVGRVTDVMATV